MNAGFSSLAVLKAQLLAEALRAGTKYDAVILAIGQGVAAEFEKLCNRKFYRTVAATFDLSADRDHLYLNRYPIESIASVAKKSNPTDGFVTLTDPITNWDAPSGLVHFGGRQGLSYETLRITFTGGFWWDITEDSSDTLPEGATALPEDLRLAWFIQCRVAWQAIDKTGVDIVKTGSSSAFVSGSLAGLALNENVREVLAAFRRFQIT